MKGNTVKPAPRLYMKPSFVAIDFETCHTKRDSACSVGFVRVDDGVVTASHYDLICPPKRDPFKFTEIHGLTWNDVKDSPTFKQMWPKVKSIFKGIGFIAAHNASFDKGVLAACCKEHKIEMPKVDFVCTMHLARDIWKCFPTKLSDVCKMLDITLNHHHAASDSLACAEIVLEAQRLAKDVLE